MKTRAISQNVNNDTLATKQSLRVHNSVTHESKNTKNVSRKYTFYADYMCEVLFQTNWEVGCFTKLFITCIQTYSQLTD